LLHCDIGEVLTVQEYETGANLARAIAEPIRLQILDILSNGELCACDILQNLPISQPTLSHHMKALTESGWVNARKKSTWMYYAINSDAVEKMHQYMINLTAKKTDAPLRAACDSMACCGPAEDARGLAETHTIGDIHHEV
jgi:ArsR family transcriptional regulator, arsenate/arsenite/antimonite-responsive transcriptional repressor